MSIASRLYHILRARLGTAEVELGDDVAPEPASRADRAASPPPAEPGIDREMAGYYANLELSYGATAAEAEKAWKRLIRRYHPDLHSQDPEKQRLATEIVKGLNRAYDKVKEHAQAR